MEVHASEMHEDPESEAEDSSAYEEDQEEDKDDLEWNKMVNKAAK